MIALDTNLLVYAHRKDLPFHERARELLQEKAEGSLPWALPWPCVHEFFAIVTNLRLFHEPTPADVARRQVSAWLRSPSVVLLAEQLGYWNVLDDLLSRSQVAGPRVHDARVAALCLQNEVREIWTADRDFSRFTPLKVHNPLMD